VEAAAYFADDSVDFVYVDARHDYTSVKQVRRSFAYPNIIPRQSAESRNLNKRRRRYRLEKRV